MRKNSLFCALVLFSTRWMVREATARDDSVRERHRRHFQSHGRLETPRAAFASPLKENSAIKPPLLRGKASEKGSKSEFTVGVKKSAKTTVSPRGSTKSKKSMKTKVSCSKQKKSKQKKSKKRGPKSAVVDDCSAAYDCKNLTNRDRDINSVVESVSGMIEVGSPEDLALQWLLYNDTLTNACNGLNPIQQRYSLAVFYYSTIGSDWINNTFWLGPQDECTWYGVRCTDGLVSSLSMDMNNLQGTLPTEIAALRYLSELHVYFNNIGGTLPTELGSLTNFKFIDLEVNQFEGDLFFSQLLNTSHTLQYLRGSDNKFVGSIPSWIGDFTGLKEFWAADNSLAGSIPTEVAQLTNLISWYIYNNALNGTIPSNIGSLTKLEEMDLSSNDLHGSIPKSIGNMRKLRRLVLTKDHLTGTIPSSLGNVTSLNDVYLNNNGLTGSIPAPIYGLVNLTYLLINDNFLTGSLTNFVSPKLTYIDMSNNDLEGTIPSSFFHQPLLTKLYLSNNTFSGTISPSFGDSTSLEVIWLNGNKLNGTIPAVPIPNGLPQIAEVLLDHNRFTGSVPSSICDLRALKPMKFTTLHADCEPPTLVFGQAQNNCRNGCCTACFIGVLA